MGIVYKTFEDYSTRIKSLLPTKSKKEFDKHMASIIIKFIKFVLTKRLGSFMKFDYNKIKNIWSLDDQYKMENLFYAVESKFVQHLTEMTENVCEPDKFRKYLFKTLDSVKILKKFYDDYHMLLSTLHKTFSVTDEKIRSSKKKLGIFVPKTDEEMKSLSLTK